MVPMNETRDGLIAIGGFAKATHLSLKALRLYDQLGLLKPSRIDPESGYRYYRADQIHPARLIRSLRQMDMPLATIRLVLAASPAAAERLVREHVAALQARALQARRLFEDVLAHIYEEVHTMALEVNVSDLPEQPIVSVTRRVHVAQLGAAIGDGLKQLYGLIESQGGQADGAPFGLYHGPINENEDGPIEICVPTAVPLAAAADVAVRILPATRAATAMLRGEQCEFPEILAGYDATHDWILSQGYAHADSPREIWHSPPGHDEVIEVAWPFKEKEQ